MSEEQATAFVTTLQGREDLTKQFTNVVAQARIDIAVGCLTILAAVYYFVRELYKKKPNTLEATAKRIWNIRRSQLSADFMGGALVLYGGISMIRAYKPSNNEISMAILLKYLNQRGLVEDGLMQVLSNLKPYRIETLKL